MLDESKLNTRKIEIVKLIQRFKAELKEITDEYTASNDPILGRQKFRRWYFRTRELFFDSFPFGEGSRFDGAKPSIQKNSDPHKLFKIMTNSYKSYLLALEEDVEKYPHDFFSRDDSLKKKKVTLDNELKWGDLKLFPSTARLKYKDKKEIDIGLGTNPIKFLILLMEGQGEVIQYIKIAEECQLSCFNDKASNKSVSPEVQTVRRDLIKELERAGMLQEEASSMIKPVTNIGYKLIKLEKDA